jgi:hypothetical protein
MWLLRLPNHPFKIDTYLDSADPDRSSFIKLFHDKVPFMGALRKFSSQAEPETLDALQEIATREGRQFQSVLGEALRDYLDRKRQHAPRRNVLEAFQQSLQERDELYKSLAK